MNSLKTAVLLAALAGLLLFVGQYFGGTGGLVIALVIALAINGGSYWFSDKLAIKMARGKQASEADYPQLHRIVGNLSAVSNKPLPDLYVSPSPQPNAFAAGRNPEHAVVCVNQGLMDLLNENEMEGVLAHELSHVHNRDILIGSVAATIATAVMFLSRFALFFGGGDRQGGIAGQLALIILGPIAAIVVRSAVTRSRETQADRSGAYLCQKPMALASALQKLESGGKARLRQGGTPAETSQAFSTLYISAPFGGAAARGIGKLFRSHPTTETRVQNLERIARDMGHVA
jgi:heat shock protein HtpX